MNVTANGRELCQDCSKPLIGFIGRSIYLRKGKETHGHFNRIHELRKAGWSISKLANEFHITVRAVYGILRRLK